MPIDPAVIDEAKVRVRDDIIDGFEGSLSPDGDTAFTINLIESPLDGDANLVGVSESLVVVPWVFRCVHTGKFLNIPPTFVHFKLPGTTLVNVVSDNVTEWVFHRYIDYLCALHHMGVSTSVRPALEPDDYLEWKAHPH